MTEAANQRIHHTGQRSVSLTFRLEQEDIAQFAKAAAAQDRQAGSLTSLPVLLAAGPVFGALVVLLLYFLQAAVLANVWFYIALALAVTLAVVFLQAVSAGHRTVPAPDGPTLGLRSYEIEPEGLIITQDGIQQAWMWQSIRDITETDTAIYLFVDRNAAHIFPKSVFESPVHAREFAAYMREKVALAAAA